MILSTFIYEKIKKLIKYNSVIYFYYLKNIKIILIFKSIIKLYTILNIIINNYIYIFIKVVIFMKLYGIFTFKSYEKVIDDL